MLSMEDQNVLGISNSFASVPAKQFLRCKEAENEYCLFAATTREQRERAYRLAYRVYERLGYVDPKSGGLNVSPYDVQDATLTLLATDALGQDVGTVTLVFDSREGLPSDEIYGPEIATLRRKGARLVEAVRYCVDTERVHSNFLMRRLLNMIFLYASRIGRCDYLINECNPHHKVFYQRKLLFEQVGSERPCLRVNGAPAVLLLLDLEVYRKNVQQFGGKHGTQIASSQRTLYPHFFTETEEEVVARFLASQQAAMTCEDAFYFGLATPVRNFQAVA